MQDYEDFDGVVSTNINITIATPRIGSLRLKSDVAPPKRKAKLTLKLDPDIGGLVDRHHLALHLGHVGSSLLVTNPRKSGKSSMAIDNNERVQTGRRRRNNWRFP
jgi:hypothetical protein